MVEHDILRKSYIPAKLKAREAQREQILCCLSPVARKHTPIHTWLYGKPGSGKTATAIHALRYLEEKDGVKSIIVNCWEKNTFYEVLDGMISELRILRAEERRTSFKLEKLRSYLKEQPLIVLLDEIDQVNPKELSTILYNLDSILSAGLICISNSIKPLEDIEERVMSRLNPHVIFFSSYSQKHLLEILTHRAELALAPNSWSQTALKQIVANAQGDARVAIQMLHRAAVLVDHQYLDRITTGCLKEQIKSAKEAKRNGILNNLTQDHRMFYELVKQKRKILSGELWQAYLQECEKVKRKPLAPRTFSDYVNRLAQTGLITSERARIKGKVRLFRYSP